MGSARTASVTRKGLLLDMQVCVPSDWTDDQVRDFAEYKNPAGTTNGWQIRREGHDALKGAPERINCTMKPNHVHIMMEA